MPKNNRSTAPSRAAAAPLFPARISEILAALPVFAWVENSEGEILAHNRRFTPDNAGIEGRACSPSAPQIATIKHGGFGEAALPVLSAYPLPPIKGCPQGLRLVTLVPDAHEAGGHALVISALLALLLDAPRPDSLPLTPQQRAVYGELSRGLSCKETAYALGISHTAVRIHLSRMRTRIGEEIIPRLRRRPNKQKRP